MDAADLGLKYAEILVWPLIAALLLFVGAKLFRARLATASPPPLSAHKLSGSSPVKVNTGLIAQSIADAETLIPPEEGRSTDPVVHLQQAVRISPEKYRDTIREISEQFQAGRVVIVDLATADEGTALRLVDFSSGLTLGAKGTFFQVSSTVLLLTPRVTVN